MATVTKEQRTYAVSRIREAALAFSARNAS